MNTVICQGCGSILRSVSMVCAECGATVSAFSKTELPSIVNTGEPLSVEPDSDPLLIERAMNRMIYQAQLRAPAGAAGSGGDGDGKTYSQQLDQMQQQDGQRSPAPPETAACFPDFFAATGAATGDQRHSATAGDTIALSAPAPHIIPGVKDALPNIVAQALQSAENSAHIVEAPGSSGADESPTLPVKPTRKQSTKNGRALPAASQPATSAGAGLAIIVMVLLALALIVGVQLMPKEVVGPPPAGPSLNGNWDFDAFTDEGDNIHFSAAVTQSGTKLDGYGQELRKGFVFSGEYKYPYVRFTKVYVDKSQHPLRGWFPVEFSGRVIDQSPDQTRAQLSGEWKLDKLQAGGVRKIRLSNDWRALVTAQAPKPKFSLLDMVGWPANTQERLQRFFFSLAVVITLFGVGIYLASVKLFAPSGLLNRLAKKEYIPSQYKSQHKKAVREFGQRLTPGGLPLGRRVDWNFLQFLPRDLAIPRAVREQNPHMVVLGAGSKGKSRLLAGMIAHDIESNDRAVVVIDSDGALVDLTLNWLAAHPQADKLSKRVIVLDPTHGGEVPCFNPLEYPQDGDLQSASHALMFGFKALYMEPPGSQNQWSQQTADILRNSAILLMANGKSLTDLPVLLTENDFRDILLEKIEKEKNNKPEYVALIEAWSRYKRMARTDQWITWIEPILNRVNPILGDPRLRPILTKPKGDLNLLEVIRERKILLVKVPQGQLHQNANLLGSLVVTGLKQAAMSLSLRSSTGQHRCALYLDEFDNFVDSETFESITKETRKFQIGLVGAVRTMQSLPEDFRNQLVINVGTVCCFSLAKKDGDLLGPQMFRVDGRKIKHQTLQNLFNKVNSVPNFELISDEEKLNIDRLVGQDTRTFFCYQVGDVAKVFQLKAPEFADPPEKCVRWKLIDQIYARSPGQI